MSYYNEGPYQSYTAGAAISANRFVKGGAAANTVIQAAAATDTIGLGVAVDGAASGAICKVQTAGVAKVLVGAGGTTLNTRVTSDATGQAVAWATTNTVYGVALETRAAGEICPVQLAVPTFNVA